MGRFSSQRLYGVILVLAILVGGYLTLRDEQQKETAFQTSPTWQPWLAHGVICNSQLVDITLPASIWIFHPPGTREMVTQSIREVVRTGRPPQAWPKEIYNSYQIHATKCFNSWLEFYQALGTEARTQIDTLVMQQGRDVTEAELRLAILRYYYEAKGTLDAALKLFPVEAVTRKK